MLGLGNNLSIVPTLDTAYNNAFCLSGEDSSIAFDTNSKMQSLFQNDFTFSGWFKFTDGKTNPSNNLFGAAVDSNNIVGLTTGKNSSRITVTYKANGDAHEQTTTSDAWDDGQLSDFVNVVLVMNRGAVGPGIVTFDLYVNGSAATLGTATLTCTKLNASQFANTSVNVKVGGTNNALGNTEGGLRGDMDEIAFFNKAFSSSEVSELYNSGVATNLLNHSASSNLLHYYHFNNSHGNDFGSGGSNGTIPEGMAFGTTTP